MKIVSLLNKEATERIFSQESLNKLSQIGKLIVNDDINVNPDTQRAKELIKGANIVITSWGSPKLDGDILNAAPDLELVIHAAGSVKGIVSRLWEKGIWVTSSAPVLGKGCRDYFGSNHNIS